MRYLEPVYFPGRPRTHYKEELELFVTYQEVFVNLSISPSIPYWFPPEFCELLPTVVGQNGQEMYSYGLNHSLPPFPAKETSQWLSLYIYMVVIFRNKMHIRSQNWSQQLRFRRRHHRKWTFFVLVTFETQTLIFNKDLIHEKKCYYHAKRSILQWLRPCFLSLSAFVIKILHSPVKLYCLAAHWAFENKPLQKLNSAFPGASQCGGEWTVCYLISMGLRATLEFASNFSAWIMQAAVLSIILFAEKSLTFMISFIPA